MPKHTRATAALPCAALLLSAGVAHAALLYDNGSLINQPGAGDGGADVSALSVTTSSLGFNMSPANSFRLADDFTIAAGETWRVDAVELFGYQTGSTTTSTFTGLTLRIWQGTPGDATAVLVWGDTTTNRLSSTSFTGDYRTASNMFLATNRPIMSLVGDVTSAGAGIELAAGTYWLDWQATSTLASGPFCPPFPMRWPQTHANIAAPMGRGRPWLTPATPAQSPSPSGSAARSSPSPPPTRHSLAPPCCSSPVGGDTPAAPEQLPQPPEYRGLFYSRTAASPAGERGRRCPALGHSSAPSAA